MIIFQIDSFYLRQNKDCCGFEKNHTVLKKNQLFKKSKAL